MSLTLLFRALVFCGLAVIAAWSGREYALPLKDYLVEAQSSTARDARISSRSIAYRIPDNQPMAFAFSQPVTLAKVLVYPAVREQARARKGGFVYGLRVRWLRPNGEELASHDVYLQSDSPDEVFASGEKWRFFRTRPELVAEQDQLVFESPSPTTRLEVSVIASHEDIVGVDLRVFAQLAAADAAAIAAYRRLTDETREQLTQPNAFPVDMLTREEELFLGSNLWRSVGPIGIDKRDFEALVLYEASSDSLLAGQGGML